MQNNKDPSHRGHRGSSSSQNTSRNVTNSSLISRVRDYEMKQKQEQHQKQKKRVKKNTTRRQTHTRTFNFLKEMDGLGGFGASEEDATFQELYAIGAVFDHLYRGGSPLNCVNVYAKEVNRAPRKPGCGGCGVLQPVDDEEEGLTTTTVATKTLGGSFNDDDTLPTTDWTLYNRMSSVDDDMYTLDEEGTYDRSFLSRSFSIASQSSVEGESDDENKNGRSGGEGKEETPFDEGRKKIQNKKNKKGGGMTRTFSMSRTLRENNNNSKRSGKKITSDQTRERSIFDDAESNNEYLDENYEGVEQVLQDDTMERLKAWSEVLVAAVEENAPFAVAAAAEATSNAAKAATAAATAAGATATPTAYRVDTKQQRKDDYQQHHINSGNDHIPKRQRFFASSACHSAACHSTASNEVKNLVHMLRNTVADGIPEEGVALQAALVRTFGSLVQKYDEGNHYNHRTEDDDFGSVIFGSEGSSMTDLTPSTPKRLNSLARAMKTIATKEPSRTYAASEQDQMERRGQTASKPIVTSRESSNSKGSSSVGATVESVDTPPQQQQQQGEYFPVSPMTNSLIHKTPDQVPRSQSGISRADTEGIGSHRGDASPVVISSRVKKVPSSIKLSPHSTTGEPAAAITSMFPHLFISPSRVSSFTSSLTTPQYRSPSDIASKNSSGTPKRAVLPKSASSSPNRRHLPPVSPSRSSLTLSMASPSRKQHLDVNIDESFVIAEIETSIDGIGTEISIDRCDSKSNETNQVTMVTPPRSVTSASRTSSSTPNSLIARNTKKRSLFRKGKPIVHATSPRSSMGIDFASHEFHSAATNNTSTESFDGEVDDSVIAIADESSYDINSVFVTNSLVDFESKFNEIETCATTTGNDVFLTESHEETFGYEIQSV